MIDSSVTLGVAGSASDWGSVSKGGSGRMDVDCKGGSIVTVHEYEARWT